MKPHYNIERLVASKTLEAKNKEVAERLGLCFHRWDVPTLQGQLYHCLICGIIAEHIWHPDFVAHPVELLRLMRGRKDYGKFVVWLCAKKTVAEHSIFNGAFTILDYTLDKTGKLVESAWLWLQQNENDPK